MLYSSSVSAWILGGRDQRSLNRYIMSSKVFRLQALQHCLIQQIHFQSNGANTISHCLYLSPWGYSTIFHSGRLRPDSKPLPFYVPFFTKKLFLSYTRAYELCLACQHFISYYCFWVVMELMTYFCVRYPPIQIVRKHASNAKKLAPRKLTVWTEATRSSGSKIVA